MSDQPDYKYRPSSTEPPELRSVSLIRARLANGAFFRATDAGLHGNNISIAVAPFGATTAQLIVTNRNTELSENITGTDSKNVLYLDVKRLTYTDFITLEVVSEKYVNATLYGRSYLEANTYRDVVVVVERLDMTKGQSFAGKCSFKLDTAGLKVGDVITIRPRLQKYNLTPYIDPNDPSIVGWDYSVRDAIQAASKKDGWIQMPKRGTDLFDSVGNTGKPELPLATFPDTLLSGGSGLPETPTGEHTGPTRSIIHINYAEMTNGSLVEYNRLFEWAGDDAHNGAWRLMS